MPNRVLRNWTASKKIAKLTADEERLFTRLIMTVDDYGRFYSDPAMIRSICFPRQDNVSTENVKIWLSKLSELLIFYSAKGDSYLEIYNFNQTVRIKKEKYPSPSESDISEFESRCGADDMQMNESCTPETKPNQTESETKPNPKPKRNSDFVNTKSPHHKCIEIYNEWILGVTGATAKLDGREGKAMKSIIDFISKQEKVSGDFDKIIESWQYILSNWNKLESFHKNRVKLSNIDSDLSNILNQLKNGKSTTNDPERSIQGLGEAIKAFTSGN